MIHFRDLPIRKKLALMMTATSAITVLLACLTFYFLVINHYRRIYEEDINGLARVIGQNCEAALAFNIPEDANKVLASLEKRPSIVAAHIDTRQGSLFARYQNAAKAAAASTQNQQQLQEQDHISGILMVSQEITVGKNLLGTLYLYDDMRYFSEARSLAGLILAVVILLALAVSMLLANKLQTYILGPILSLATLSHTVSEKQDYSARAAKQGNDEIGNLTDDFNKMLNRIETREADLRESESRFRTLIDQAVDPFFLHDLDGEIIDVNQRLIERLGYTREQLLTMPVAALDTTDQTPEELKKFWHSISPRKTISLEKEFRRQDDSTFPVEVNLGRLDFNGKTFIMNFARDISERKTAEQENRKLESQLAQAQKMESIGTLAGGIAHDFNNILTAILGYSDLARYTLPPGSPTIEKINEVIKAGNRARELVKQILTFSRQAPQDRGPVQVQLIAKETVKLLRASIPAFIEIRQDIPSDCGSVMGNPTQIHQILMNLCTNGYHAMRNKEGVLGIKLAPVHISAEDIMTNLNLVPGNYLQIEVSDTGHGMDKATQEKIFDPYFTTKPQGEGTGMGLSVVHGIVKSYGGHISVYSEPGKGSTFHVYLPMIDSPNLNAIADLEVIRTGNERILLVDDEEQIVLLEKELLEGLGYRVTTHISPEATLAEFRQHPEAFDLVITDMAMPKLTGTQLTHELLTIRPDLPIILCTGFSETVNAEIAKTLGIKEFIMKPVLRNELAKTIRKVLDHD